MAIWSEEDVKLKWCPYSKDAFVIKRDEQGKIVYFQNDGACIARHCMAWRFTNSITHGYCKLIEGEE